MEPATGPNILWDPFTRGKYPVPTYGRLGGSQDRSRRVRKISPSLPDSIPGLSNP